MMTKENKHKNEFKTMLLALDGQENVSPNEIRILSPE